MNLNLSLSPLLFGAITIIVFAWLVSLSILFYKILNHYQKLTGGLDKKDLKSVLENLLEKAGKESKEVAGLKKDLQEFENQGIYNLQKTGLVRFNPFSGTGGNQSFCLSLLDGEDSGLVISSLHGRDTTRIYAKPVKKGKAVGYDFSNEEDQAIKQAKKLK